MNTAKIFTKGSASMMKWTLRDFHRMAVINKFVGSHNPNQNRHSHRRLFSTS